MATERSPGAPRGPRPVGRVPFATAAPERRDPLLRGEGHDRYQADRLTGHLAGAIVALTPIHVGTGTIERTARVVPAQAGDAPLVFPFMRAGDRLVLPGPTLKGALRAVVEAVVPSCLTVRGEATRLLPPPLHPLRPCTRRDELCAACRLFGGSGYQGRLRVADALLISGESTVAYAPRRYTTRLGQSGLPNGRRFDSHGSPGRGSVPIEVCPEGARFDWRIDFANLRAEELGVLLVALGQGDPPLWLKLGGYRAACFGSVRVEVATLAVDDVQARYLALAGDRETTDPAPYLQALGASGLLLTDRLDQLARLLRYPGDGNCPTGGD